MYYVLCTIHTMNTAVVLASTVVDIDTGSRDR